MPLKRSDLFFVAVGGLIGYQIQLASTVEGVSMLPTLRPAQRLLHVPMWVLGVWCWPLVQASYLLRRLSSCVEGSAEDNGFYLSNFKQQSLSDSLAWQSHKEPRVGDVVLAIIDAEGTTVCKRVLGVTADYAEVAAWESSRFRPDNSAEEDAMEGYDEAQHRHEMEEVLSEGGDRDGCDHPAPASLSASSSSITSAAAVEGILPFLPEPLSQSELQRLHKTADSRECLDAAELINPLPQANSNAQQQQQLPRRSQKWDFCRERGVLAGDHVRWMWLEGDNASHSFDSRNVGAVPDVCLKGLVLGVWWPLKDAKLI